MPLLASTYRNDFTCSSDHFQYLAQSSGSIKSFRGVSTLPNGDTVVVGHSLLADFSFQGLKRASGSPQPPLSFSVISGLRPA